MAEKEIDLRRLVIKAFHMTDVEWGEHNNITTDGHMTVSKEMIDQLVAQDDCIEKIDTSNTVLLCQQLNREEYKVFGSCGSILEVTDIYLSHHVVSK